MRVAEIVRSVAADGKWRSRLDEICDTLDEAKIRSPKKWRGRTPPWRCWSDCDDKPILTKMIEYRLRQAKQQEKPAPETLA